MYMQFPSHKRRAVGMESSPAVVKRQRVQPFDGPSFLDTPPKALTSPPPLKSHSLNTMQNPSFKKSDASVTPSTPPLHLIQNTTTQFGFGFSDLNLSTIPISRPLHQHNTSFQNAHSHSMQRPEDTQFKSSPAFPSSQPQQDQLPWWLQQPRRVHPSSSTNSSCYYCEAPDNHTACERCDHRLCEMCTRFCDDCSVTGCSCCTVVDYDSRFDRTLCLECYDDNRAKSHTHGHCGVESSRFGGDGDDVTLS